jgi:hypothetical protein
MSPLHHVSNYHVTHITTCDGTGTPRIQLPCHPHHNTWWHRHATFTLPITHYTEHAIAFVIIQVFSRDLPDHTRWIINRHITVIPLRGPRFLPVAPPNLPVAPRRVQTTSISSLCKPCHTSDSWCREEGGSLLLTNDPHSHHISLVMLKLWSLLITCSTCDMLIPFHSYHTRHELYTLSYLLPIRM